MRNYWLVNHRTKKYVPLSNIESDFFDGDWKAKTPFADEDYENIYCQTVHDDQKFGEHMCYEYDLARDGMIVGLYYDADIVSKDEVKEFISKLRREQDAAALYKYPLKRFKE